MKRIVKKSNSSRIVNIALTQMPCSADPDANLARQLNLIERAAKGGAQIICTQELFHSQYFCQVEDHRFFKLAEPIPGPSTDAMSKLALNQISAPVRTPFGWHIIQVLERRKQDVTADKERVRAQIAIRQRKSDEAFQDWVRQVRDRAYVEVRLDDR